MGYAIYKVGKRWGGYGVPAVCEHPDCKEEIDRGISYACGEEPFSEFGCDRYFCEKHKPGMSWDTEKGDYCKHGTDEEVDDGDECDANCEHKEVCERCAKGEAPFDYKPETKEWLEHLLKDKSWATWRKENKEEVKEIRHQITSP